ncbi:MAG: coproporphyrinogen III oxidase family protein [Berryella intestinalis]|uniref:coproporphyrinogen III oxidase family protein n=1 Tax=Berryella intestinalis TaxID=1531429 RepID=UPI002A74CFF3|nr:coproporphyrinogen III oxidase family protein [Berryella intestinalis]MDY3129668.1 coproporphyrinogen III oxidase family protein [Berryella intestinalis]
MLSERLLTKLIKNMTKSHLAMVPTTETHLPQADPARKYMLYMHVPFCQVLCPYCSFNRYPYREEVARPYFESMRKEMLMLKDLGYDFESIYVGGGTPTIMIDELCETLDLARETFSIKEVSSETNPNHLIPEYLEKMKGRVQRLSVGVQSFDDELLKQMDRYKKYGSGAEILERIGEAAPYFDSLNVDMIFNFPSQTEDILFSDLEKISLCGCQQTTFSPLYISNATTQKMVERLGAMDYDKEYRFYQIIDGVLTGGDDPLFERRTLWTFNRNNELAERERSLMVDEYAVQYDEYPAIGSGAITHLDGTLYVNTFSLSEYSSRIEAGRMSVKQKCLMSKTDLMRYQFVLNLYNLRLDKKKFQRVFGTTVENGLPMEMAFMRAHRAFATDDESELTLTPKGRYLTLVMYRQFLSGLNNLRDQARAALTGDERVLQFEDAAGA